MKGVRHSLLTRCHFLVFPGYQSIFEVFSLIPTNAYMYIIILQYIIMSNVISQYYMTYGHTCTLAMSIEFCFISC